MEGKETVTLFFVIVTIVLLLSLVNLLEKNNSLQKQLDSANGMKDLYSTWWSQELHAKNEALINLTTCEYVNTELENFINNFDCECYCDSPTRPSFLTIAEEVATDHNYKKDVYDCTQFSDDLVRQLKAEGWEARKNIGFFNGKLHEWVIIDINIEATSGRVIEPRVFEKYYRD